MDRQKFLNQDIQNTNHTGNNIDKLRSSLPPSEVSAEIKRQSRVEGGVSKTHIWQRTPIHLSKRVHVNLEWKGRNQIKNEQEILIRHFIKQNMEKAKNV